MWSSDMLPRVPEPLHSRGGFDGLSKCYAMFVVSETAGRQQGHAVASLAHAVASLAQDSTLPVVCLGSKLRYSSHCICNWAWEVWSRCETISPRRRAAP